METVKTKKHFERSQALQNQSIQDQLKGTEISFLETRLSQAKQEQIKIRNKSVRLYEYHLVADDIQRIISKAYHEAYTKLSSTGLFNQLYQKEYETFTDFKIDLKEIFTRIFFSEGKDKIYDFKKLDFFNQKHQAKLEQQAISISDAWLNQLVACLRSKSLAKNIILQQLTPEWLFSRTLRLFVYLSELTREDLVSKAKQMQVKKEGKNLSTSFNLISNPQTYTPIVKPYTKKELTQLYGISRKTLRRWLVKHDTLLGKNTKIFNVKQIDFIFNHFGFPRVVMVKK